MPSSILQIALYKRARRIERLVLALARRSSVEALHKLRVELKKLRALLRLMRALAPRFPYREINDVYKPLFRRAGEVREWQLQAQYFAQVPSPPEDFAAAYRAFLVRGLARAEARWQKLVREYGAPPADRVQLLAGPVGGAWSLEALRGYFRGLRAEFRRLAASDLSADGETLHDIRKLLKEYAANRRFVHKRLHYTPGHLPGLPADTTAFENALGRWHDLVIARERLGQDLAQPGWFEQERAHGELVGRYWEREAEKEYNRILEFLNS